MVVGGKVRGAKDPCILKFDIFLLNFYQKNCFISFEWLKLNFTTSSLPGKTTIDPPRKKSFRRPQMQ